MSDYTIIDRRVNPKGKNLSNRQRFLNRTRTWIKEKVRQKSLNRSITSNDGESISISNDDISEPVFDYNRSVGDWDRVLPGNKEFISGDKIKRPPGGGRGSGSDASDTGESEDEFSFTLTKEEYLNILFEDLELPDLVKTSEKAATTYTRKRAGYSSVGTPNNLDLEQSLKKALGRRIALAFPLDKKIKEKEEELLNASEEEKAAIIEEIEHLKSRRANIAYIDQVDVKYKRFDKVPTPNSQAVVFCLMDVSGSMGEHEKELAKRFFLLLYLFLQRKYQKVDIVFIRHTTEAEECTEKEFFYGQESGGTIVSTGIKKIHSIVTERYPTEYWNIYCVQASDGDNTPSDNSVLREEVELLLPKCQYYIYNEVHGIRPYGYGTTAMYDMYENLSMKHNNVSVINMTSTDQIVPEFRKVFSKKK